MPSRNRLTTPRWLGWLPAPAYVVLVVLAVAVGLVAVLFLLGFVLAIVRELDIAVLSTLSGHAPRRMAWILAACYAVALACAAARGAVRRRWLRAALLVPIAPGLAMFVGLMPGRYVDRGAADRETSTAFGNAAPFGEIVIWVTLAVAFVGLLVLVLAVVAGRFWWLPVLVGWLAVAGATGLVVHLNAPGALGEAPESITAYLARRVHAGDDFEMVGRSGPRLWLSEVTEVGCAEALQELDAPSSLPSCRDGLLLSGTGQSHRLRSGRVDCVLLAPQLGHTAGEWQGRLAGSRIRTALGPKDIRVSAPVGDDVWMVCDEAQGQLPSVPSRGPLIRTVGRLVISVEVGLL